MTEVMSFGPIEVRFDDRVLRPRPWTLAQAHWAAELVEGKLPGRAVELCAGAGQIGLAFGMFVPHRLVLVDIDPVACDFARANAESAGIADRVEVRVSPLESALAPHEWFEIMLVDPPWVRSALTSRFPGDPLLAIDGGPEGMDVAFACVDVIHAHLARGGHAIVQLGDASQVSLLTEHMSALGGSPSLELIETRDFGVDGVLLHLRR